MAFTDDDDDEIECDIIESYGVFSQSTKFWNKEVNFISWNRRPAKIDIRSWQKDHEKCGKGIALTREEAEKLVKLLNEILKTKPGTSKKKTEKQKTENQKQGKAGAGNSGKARTKKNIRGSGEKSDSFKAEPFRKIIVSETLEPFYNELKLIFGSGPDECKRARNVLLKKYHPDINTGNIAHATRKTIKIKEAYEKIITWWKENSK